MDCGNFTRETDTSLAFPRACTLIVPASRIAADENSRASNIPAVIPLVRLAFIVRSLDHLFPTGGLCFEFEVEFRKAPAIWSNYLAKRILKKAVINNKWASSEAS